MIPLHAARVVFASKHSPGPSPYIGWKWSNPQMPSKPSPSAKRTRDASSFHGIRCWAMSKPNRIVTPRADLVERALAPRDESYPAPLRGAGAEVR